MFPKNMLSLVRRIENVTFHLARLSTCLFVFSFRELALRHIFGNEEHMHVSVETQALFFVRPITDNDNLFNVSNAELGLVIDQKVGSTRSNRRG